MVQKNLRTNAVAAENEGSCKFPENRATKQRCTVGALNEDILNGERCAAVLIQPWVLSSKLISMCEIYMAKAKTVDRNL